MKMFVTPHLLRSPCSWYKNGINLSLQFEVPGLRGIVWFSRYSSEEGWCRTLVNRETHFSYYHFQVYPICLSIVRYCVLCFPICFKVEKFGIFFLCFLTLLYLFTLCHHQPRSYQKEALIESHIYNKDPTLTLKNLVLTAAMKTHYLYKKL